MIDIKREKHLHIIRRHVEQYHYLHKWPDPRSLPFAYRITINGREFAPDGRLCGVLVLKKPQHQRQRGLFGYPGEPTAWQVLDLARVWINPEFQGTTHKGHSLSVFSQAVSKLWQPVGPPDQRLRRLQRDWLEHHPPRYPNRPYHIRILISYCQLNHHQGTAYRASGFKSIGYTSDGTKECYLKALPQPKYKWVGWHQPVLSRDMVPA
jgi:hypothetical protein